MVFFFFFFCNCALGRVLEKRQTKSWTQRTPENERRIANSEGRHWETIKHSTYISWTLASASLVLTKLKSPLASQLKATLQSSWAARASARQAKIPVGPSISSVAGKSDSESNSSVFMGCEGISQASQNSSWPIHFFCGWQIRLQCNTL